MSSSQETCDLHDGTNWSHPEGPKVPGVSDLRRAVPCRGRATVTSVAPNDDLGIVPRDTAGPSDGHRNKRTFDPGHFGAAAARCDQTPISANEVIPVAQLHTTSTPSAGSAVPTRRPEPRQRVTVGEEIPMSEVLRRYGGDDIPRSHRSPPGDPTRSRRLAGSATS